jgi:hypothetical protein
LLIAHKESEATRHRGLVASPILSQRFNLTG